jgi:hypothetical protein
VRLGAGSRKLDFESVYGLSALLEYGNHVHCRASCRGHQDVIHGAWGHIRAAAFDLGVEECLLSALCGAGKVEGRIELNGCFHWGFRTKWGCDSSFGFANGSVFLRQNAERDAKILPVGGNKFAAEII